MPTCPSQGPGHVAEIINVVVSSVSPRVPYANVVAI